MGINVCGDQLHATQGACPWRVAHHLWVHGACPCVGDSVVVAVEQRHEGLEGQGLVGGTIAIGLEASSLVDHLATAPERAERANAAVVDLSVGDGDRAEVVGVSGRAVLEPERASVREEDIDDRPF